MDAVTPSARTGSRLDDALWTAYESALRYDLFDTARELMTLVLALEQRQLLRETLEDPLFPRLGRRGM